MYYAANVIEAVSVAAVWWTRATGSPYHDLGFGLLVGGTAFSIVSMLLYYAFGHPNRKNTWGWTLCRKARKSSYNPESTNM